MGLVVETRTTCSILVGILKERDNLRDVDLDGCIVMKWLYNQLYVD